MLEKRTRDGIVEEIRDLYRKKVDLSYSNMNRHHVSLFRAAIRQFGSWRDAVEAAGLGYDDVRRYKSWTRERIVERIRELSDAGEDLSWRHISTRVDPQLAAAATRPTSYRSWKNAVEAAGINYEGIRRYQDWDQARILSALRARSAAGEPLNAGTVCQSDTALITAARRTFGSWDNALAAAGLDPGGIRQRAAGQRRSRRSPSGREL